MRQKIPLKKIPCHQPKTSWEIFVDPPFQNCEKIFPLQQKKVAAFVNDLSHDDNVQKIIIFGSSVTEKCHSESDVDIYVQMKENKKLKLSAYDFLYDLWTNFNIDNRMMDEIEKKGVTVYERNAI